MVMCFCLVRKVQTLTDILLTRASATPDDRLFSVYNAKGVVTASLTCSQLHRRAERLGSLLQDKAGVVPGSVVALMYLPGEFLFQSFLTTVCAVCDASLLGGGGDVHISVPEHVDQSFFVSSVSYTCRFC